MKQPAVDIQWIRPSKLLPEAQNYIICAYMTKSNLKVFLLKLVSNWGQVEFIV